MILKNIKVEGNKCSFDLKADFATANSLRRSLISDIYTFAPSKVLIKTNTSCATDEYIAHRISMIPFVFDNSHDNVNEDTTNHASVSGRTFMTSDLSGPFKTIYDVPIIKLIDEQAVDIEIFFTKGKGSEHAKFSPVAAVAYEIDNKIIHMAFESINGETPVKHLKEALQSLNERLEHTEREVDKILYKV